MEGRGIGFAKLEQEFYTARGSAILLSLISSPLLKAGGLSWAFTVEPLLGDVYAQITDPARLPTETRRTAGGHDEDFD